MEIRIDFYEGKYFVRAISVGIVKACCSDYYIEEAFKKLGRKLQEVQA